MKEGTLKLKAGGFGLSPSASLKFNGDKIARDNYIPVIGLFGVGGKRFHAYRCELCSYVLFKY
jgi:hypothetical protein